MVDANPLWLMSSYKGDIWTQRRVQETAIWRRRQRVGWCVHKPRIVRDHQETTRSWERGVERILPQGLLKEPTLQMPWFRTPGLQTFERIHFCVEVTQVIALCYSSPGKLIRTSSCPRFEFLIFLEFQLTCEKLRKCPWPSCVSPHSCVPPSPEQRSSTGARETGKFPPSPFWGLWLG